MNIMQSKQEARSERKKRKLEAMVNIVKMNDKDHEDGRRQSQDVDEDGFIMVRHKKFSKKRKSSESKEQPLVKSPRKELQTDAKQQPAVADTDSSSPNCDRSAGDNADNTNDLKYELKRLMNARQRHLRRVPTIKLREFGHCALLSLSQENRTPIFVADIHDLLMTTVLGRNSPCSSARWCKIEKQHNISQSVVVIIDGFSLFHYLLHESKFRKSNSICKKRFELALPVGNERSILEEIAQVPITFFQAKTLIEKYGSFENAMQMINDPTLYVKGIFPVDLAAPEAKQSLVLPSDDKFPRTKLLLSALQMVDEGYPMPLQGELAERFKQYVFTKPKYAAVNDNSPMYALDCEMCRTILGSELTRISVVNESLDVVYHHLVRPTNEIIDYMTSYSGITPEMLIDVTKTMADVQQDVIKLLPPDAILVGQSLNSDLQAMKMMHPYIIDTSVCFNLSGQRKRKSKLKALSLTFLKQHIQESAEGHDPTEDSVASMKLVKMKLANSVEFGDRVLEEKRRSQDCIRAQQQIANNLIAHAAQRDKSTAVVSSKDLRSELKQMLLRGRDVTVSNPVTKVTIHEARHNRAVVKKVGAISMDHALVIANLTVTEDELHSDVVEQTMRRLDAHINDIYQETAQNGLFIVLMGGSPDCDRGVAKVTIKSGVNPDNTAEPTADAEH